MEMRERGSERAERAMVGWEQGEEAGKDEAGRAKVNGESGPGSGGGWLGALSEAGNTLRFAMLRVMRSLCLMRWLR
eukprot:3746950-Rhodomonas_salina.1